MPEIQVKDKLITLEELGVATSGFKGTLTASDDLNDILSNGYWEANANSLPSNVPSGVTTNSFILNYSLPNIGEVYQIFVTFVSGKPVRWERRYFSESWGDWCKIPIESDVVAKTGDTMTGDLTLSANGGTVKLHPYWDSTDGQSLGFYIYAKNSEELNAIFLPLIDDDTGGHNIRLLSDLEPVTVAQGGTGATAAGFTPLNNLGLQYEALTLAFNNGTALYTFPNPVHLIGCRGLVGETVIFSRVNGFTGHQFFSIRNPTYTGDMTVDVYYAVINS